MESELNRFTVCGQTKIFVGNRTEHIVSTLLFQFDAAEPIARSTSYANFKIGLLIIIIFKLEYNQCSFNHIVNFG